MLALSAALREVGVRLAGAALGAVQLGVATILWGMVRDTACKRRLVLRLFTACLPRHGNASALMPCPARSAVLFPLVVTVYVTWWFLTFFDNFFSVRPGSSACASAMCVELCYLPVELSKLTELACAACVRGLVWLPCLWPGLCHIYGIHHWHRSAPRHAHLLTALPL